MTPQARRAIVVLGVVALIAVGLLLRVLLRERRIERPPPPAAADIDAPASTTRAPGAARPLAPRPLASPPPPAVARAANTAPSPPDAGPSWEESLDAEGRYAAQLQKASVDDLKAGFGSVAARHPSVRVVSVACIDRPCQAEVEGPNAADLAAFARDVQGLYQGHLGGRFTRSEQGGVTIFRGSFEIGTVPRDKLDLSGLETPRAVDW